MPRYCQAKIRSAIGGCSLTTLFYEGVSVWESDPDGPLCLSTSYKSFDRWGNEVFVRRNFELQRKVVEAKKGDAS
jgi:hypothetical protein